MKILINYEALSFCVGKDSIRSDTINTRNVLTITPDPIGLMELELLLRKLGRRKEMVGRGGARDSPGEKQ